MTHLGLIPTVATVLLMASVPGFANDQLARTLGVEDEGYTTAELVALRGAMEDGNCSQVRFIKQQHADPQGPTGLNAGAEQIALSMGVDPASYTVAELVALRSAMAESDCTCARAIMQHAVSSTGYDPDNWTQLAISEGMDPYECTAADLVKAHSN